MTLEDGLYKVGLYTLGCKVSSYETEAVSEAFEREGFAVSSFEDVCDVYVINTCTVTAESDAKSRKYIRRAIKRNPSAKVLVMGCYSQRAPAEVAEIDGVSAVVGTAGKLSVVDIAKRLLRGNTAGPVVSVGTLDGAEFERMIIRRAPRTRGYVKIEDGCDCSCSYCAISAARGPVRSKPKEEIIEEVSSLYRSGTEEIVLTGIETGSYGKDFKNGYTLGDLLCELDGAGACRRIRLGSMAPELVGRDFVEKIQGLSILVPHIHLSMQSGSDSVLAAMRRRYNRRMAIENIRRLREAVPGITFTADLMVGFPGETQEDFADTVSFVSEAMLLDAHVFTYSRREGTDAAYMDGQISEREKKARSAALIAEKNRVRELVLADIVERGEPLMTVFETGEDGRYTGHSDTYVEVLADSKCDVRGKLLAVAPKRHDNGIIYGEIIT